MRKYAFFHVKLSDWLGACVIGLTTLGLVLPVLRPDVRSAQQFSSYHAIANAVHAYNSDWDDVMPLAFYKRDTIGTWAWSSYVAVPDGWTTAGGRNLPPQLILDRAVAYNSLKPYGVTSKTYETPGYPAVGNSTWGPARTALTLSLPWKVNVAYNGLLHQWPVSAVAVPARLTMFWQGYHENSLGRQHANPSLNCPLANDPCVFNPTSASQFHASAWFGVDDPNFTVWNYGHSSMFLSVDGTAELHLLEAPICPNTVEDTDNNPFACFSSDYGGKPAAMWECQSPGSSVAYLTFFRPDKTFTGSLNCP